LSAFDKAGNEFGQKIGLYSQGYVFPFQFHIIQISPKE
jgi:hypothetical protein